jgi:hypothetical protein
MRSDEQSSSSRDAINFRTRGRVPNLPRCARTSRARPPATRIDGHADTDRRSVARQRGPGARAAARDLPERAGQDVPDGTASVGKFGGSFAAARLSGLGWRDAASLGILMNTRGLVELIVLNIGLDLRVISPRLFAMMVFMAVVTTVSTTPILQAISSYRSNRAAPANPVPSRA